MKAEEQDILYRVVLICSVILGALLVGLSAMVERLPPSAANLANGLRTGLGLVIFWLLVTAALRSIDRLQKNVPTAVLLLAGLAVSVLGTSAYFACRLLFGWSLPTEQPLFYQLLFYVGAGTIASTMALIGLRVKDPMRRNVLQISFLSLVAILFFYFAA